MAVKRLVVIMEIDEDRLREGSPPQRRELSRLPERLGSAVAGTLVSGALEATHMYLVDGDMEQKLLDQLEEVALDYHTYAVDEHGEMCEDHNCPFHGGATVIRLDDRRPRC